MLWGERMLWLKRRRNISITYNMENEIWEPIRGYEGYYEVSNMGRVKSLSRTITKNNGVLYKCKEKTLKLELSTNGYHKIDLHKNGNRYPKLVHQLVAIAFLQHSTHNKLVINHKDFNKLNNKAKNLELVTNRENCNKKHLKHSSIYTGVSFFSETKKWCARITIDRKIKHLGYFINKHEAHLAYEQELHTRPHPHRPDKSPCFGG